MCAIELWQAQEVIHHFLHRFVVFLFARSDHTKQGALGNVFGVMLLVIDLVFGEVVLQVAVTFAQEMPNIHQMRLHLASV